MDTRASDTGSADRGARQTRRVDIEALRALSIVGVIVMHATSSSIHIGDTGPGPLYWVALALNSLARASVPLFFAIAGWAQLSRTIVEDETGWLGRRLLRLVVPLAVWSAIYVLSDGLRAAVAGAAPWQVADLATWLEPKFELFILGPGVRAHLWFMYFLIPMTVVVWLVQAVPRPSPETLRVSFSMGYAIVAAVVLLVFAAIGILHLTVSWIGFGWTIAYAALGYGLLSGSRTRGSRLGIVLYLVAAAAIGALGYVVGYNQWPILDQGPLVAAAAIGVLLAAPALRRLDAQPAARAFAIRAGALSYGVYFAHLLVLDWLTLAVARLELAFDLPGTVRLVVLLALTVVLTFGLVAIWHRSSRLTAILG